MTQDKRTKTEMIGSILNKADDAVDAVKDLAPPGVRGPLQTADDVLEVSRASLGIFARLKQIWKKKK